MVKWIVVLLVSGCALDGSGMSEDSPDITGTGGATLATVSTGGTSEEPTGGATALATGGRQTGGAATGGKSTGGTGTGGAVATGGAATGGSVATGGLATGGSGLLVATGGVTATGGTLATGGSQPSAGAGSCPATDIDGTLLSGAHAGDTCASLGAEKHYCTTVATAAAIYCVACTENLLNCDTPTVPDHCGTRIDKLNCGRCGQKCSNTQTCQPFAGMYACISSS